jgi:DNA-binding MarR family transcriptional regulator
MPKRRIQLSPDFDKRYPDASAVSTEAAMNTILTADLLLKQIAKLLKPLELTPSGGLVLSMLADSKEPLSPIQIAERLILSRAAMTSLLDSLAKKGFAKREPHPYDRRKLVIQITKKGREVAQKFRPLIHRHQKLWFGVLPVEEQRTLIRLLHHLQDKLAE